MTFLTRVGIQKSMDSLWHHEVDDELVSQVNNYQLILSIISTGIL